MSAEFHPAVFFIFSSFERGGGKVSLSWERIFNYPSLGGGARGEGFQIPLPRERVIKDRRKIFKVELEQLEKCNQTTLSLTLSKGERTLNIFPSLGRTRASKTGTKGKGFQIPLPRGRVIKDRRKIFKVELSN